MMKRLSILLLFLLCIASIAYAEQIEEYIWPVPASRLISQGYTPRTHAAIDIIGAPGDSIVASKGGTVIYAFTGCQNEHGLETGVPCGPRTGCSKRSRENNPLHGFCNYGFGNGVVLRHSDGAYTVYAHFSNAAPSLRRGSRVAQGQHLGEMGSTGRSSGTHLHFSVTAPRSEGFMQNRLDPADVLTHFVYVATTEAIVATSYRARLEGRVSFLGPPPERIGIFLGESESTLAMSTEYFDTEYGDRTLMKMYYDVDHIEGWALEPGATYYWRCYAIQDGHMELGEVRSFTMLEEI